MDQSPLLTVYRSFILSQWSLFSQGLDLNSSEFIYFLRFIVCLIVVDDVFVVVVLGEGRQFVCFKL